MASMIKGCTQACRFGLPLLVFLIEVLPTAVQAQAPTPAEPLWKPLAEDGLHDPYSPALEYLQEPEEALSVLPRDTAGNNVNWVKALEDGYIEPRTNILPDTELQVLESEILMTDTATMPLVLFPHKPHTQWLDCTNCHEELFISKAGATPVNMFAVLQGEYCGRCHGAVAFPLTECNRCHSVPRSEANP
jgi:c(7)-type cytochrome triheme protein